MREDRRVHAWGFGRELVRYDKAGKWYVEWSDGTPVKLNRKAITIDEAVRIALLWFRTDDEGSVRIGIPGGNTFDRKFHKALYGK